MHGLFNALVITLILRKTLGAASVQVQVLQACKLHAASVQVLLAASEQAPLAWHLLQVHASGHLQEVQSKCLELACNLTYK